MNSERMSEIKKIRSEVLRLDLIGSDVVASYPVEELGNAYNGTGPDWLPESIRKSLDSIAAPFLPAVMVHDVDFTLSDGSVDAFKSANLRLLLNCIKCANDAYPLFSAGRYKLYLEAAVIYRACTNFGWIAWRLAYNTKKENQ